VQLNWGVNQVYITKQMRLNGGCVVAPYVYSQGTLNSIGMAVNESGVLVSDISLGSLVIGAETTVAELAAAVMKHNRGWEDGDQLTFFYAKQYVDALGTPRAAMDSEKVVLDVSDETPLTEVVTSLVGLASVGGKLGMSEALENGGASWCHSRNNGSQLKVSTQRLVVVSELLELYQSREAMRACAASYGGINTKAVYLNPVSLTGASGVSGSGSSSGGSNASGGAEQSGSQSGGSNEQTGQNAGGNTGGDTGGGNTPGDSPTNDGDGN
jgi:hypothetical protein